jgi:hypothetical protein
VLQEELRNYHRDEDYKIVKQRDDLVSALRYAIMMRRNGRALAQCEGIGFGPTPYAGQRPEQPRRPQVYARATAGHPDGEANPFTGQ